MVLRSSSNTLVSNLCVDFQCSPAFFARLNAGRFEAPFQAQQQVSALCNPTACVPTSSKFHCPSSFRTMTSSRCRCRLPNYASKPALIFVVKVVEAQRLDWRRSTPHPSEPGLRRSIGAVLRRTAFDGSALGSTCLLSRITSHPYPLLEQTAAVLANEALDCFHPLPLPLPLQFPFVSRISGIFGLRLAIRSSAYRLTTPGGPCQWRSWRMRTQTALPSCTN